LPYLGPKESVIIKERAKCGGTWGEFYLTNKRLIFEHEAGIITKRIYISLDVPLGDILALNVEGRFKPKLIVITKSRAGRREIEVQDPTRWIDKIWKAFHKFRPE